MIAALAILLGAIAFAPGAADMWGRWFAADSYYGHGPLVPLLSLWMVWSDRRRLAELPVRSSPAGLVLVAGAVLLSLFSLVEDVHFTINLAMLAALVGALLVVQGGPRVRRMWFPLLFLAFMVPMPQIALARLTFDLKLLAARIAVGAIDTSGIPVVLEGSTIHLSDVSVTVDDVCSGLKTLIALVAMGAVFAYFERSRGRAIAVLVLAGPIAILANCARILLLCWLASIGSSAARPGTLHDMTGLAVYAVALVTLLALRRLLAPAPEDGAEFASTRPAPEPRAPGAPALACLAFLLGLGAAGSVLLHFTQPVPAPTDRTRHIPASVAGWTGRDVEVHDRVYLVLETRDLVIREYEKPGLAAPVVLYVVHAADSRKVAHPPEICFSGGGYVARDHRVDDLPGTGLEAVRLVLDRPPSTLLVYYWYRIDGRDTASYLDHQFRSALGRIRRERREGSMIRLSTPVLGDDLEAAEARIEAFATEVLPEALEALR